MNKVSNGILRIGTSGIVVPGSKDTFPVKFQDKSRLNYYSWLFNTLEVNSTFRKVPIASTLQKWSMDVPETFQFTLKLWKEITHVKQLNVELDKVDIFYKAVQNIGDKKGCLLVQFHGSITADYGTKVEQILQRLQEFNHQNQWRKAIEFRSVTWYTTETIHLLKTYGAVMVLQDMPNSNNLELELTSDFLYYRFHGPTGNYRGDYTDEFLGEQAKHIRHYLQSGKDVYVYFNNTMGDAYKKCNDVKSMVEN